MNQGANWFERTIKGLVTGDTSFVKYANHCDARGIRDVCRDLVSNGFARRSRSEWWTINHPTLGVVQWRHISSWDVGTYFVLMVNGREIFEVEPGGKGLSYTRWLCGSGWAKASYDEHRDVERFLGTIEEGSQMFPNRT